MVLWTATLTPKGPLLLWTETLTPQGPLSRFGEPGTSKRRNPLGRPRQYVINKFENVATPLKSKTGCLSCRSLKKKCDEAKPTCERCRINNRRCVRVLGVGIRQVEPIDELSVPVDGVKTSVDRLLLNHVSAALDQAIRHSFGCTQIGQILLHMACTEDPSSRGLMHALLWLSGSHLHARGAATREVRNCALLHYSRALSTLRTKLESCQIQDHKNRLDDLAIAQTLMICQESLIRGHVSGEYNTHLGALKHILASKPKGWPQTPFRRFVVDLYVYYNMSYSVTASSSNKHDVQIPDFIQYCDGTFSSTLKEILQCQARIATLRSVIRRRRRLHEQPTLQPSMTAEANSIISALQAFQPRGKPGEFLHQLSLVSQQGARVGILQTKALGSSNPALEEAVDTGLALFQEMVADASPTIITGRAVLQFGIAAYTTPQRAKVEHFLDLAHKSRGTATIERTRAVLLRIWELMDEGSDEAWDWEMSMKKMQLDFLVD